MPAFPSDVHWLNVERPLSATDFEGHVTVVYFWASSSVNAVRVLPFMNRLYAYYQPAGLEVVGIHSPQFSFEDGEEAVKRAAAQYAIVHPLALDRGFGLWTQYGNQAWPTFYVIDARGRVRQVLMGEDQRATVERSVRELLEEDGRPVPFLGVPYQPEGDIQFAKLGTPEIFLGYENLSHFGSPEPVRPDESRQYSAELEIEANHAYLVGQWEIQKERALLRGNGGKLVIRYEASRVYALLSSLHEGRLRVEVWLDGRPLAVDNAGRDIWFRDGKSYLEVDEARIYEVVDMADLYGAHTLELVFLSADSSVYSLMFG